MPRRPFLIAVLLVAVLSLAAGSSPAAPSGRKGRTRTVVLVLIDGLRWQEVFTGAEEALISKELGGVEKPEPLRAAYWRPAPEARREALMPWLWGVVARQGQLYGNRLKGSPARVTNTFHFSYPGYNEMIVGFADPRIDSNDKRPNANVSVFEWLHGKTGFAGKVSAFGAWDTVAWIVNRERCGFPVFSGFDPVNVGRISARQELLNVLKRQIPRPWEGEPYDALTVHSAIEFQKANPTRAMWITLGETDEYAHAGRYDRYLDAAHRTDDLLRTLWDTFQAQPDTRGRTTLLFCVDHGRGLGREWTSHGVRYRGSHEIWLGAIGPDTPPLGERSNVAEVTQGQVAATVAALAGHDYRAAEPRAAPPIRDLLRTE